MNTCTNCEAENNVTAKYCSICGFKLAAINNITSPPATDAMLINMKIVYQTLQSLH
jgi:zinc-ribbon domain